MKHWFLLLLLAALTGAAQQPADKKGIPPFQIMLSNGQSFSAGQLKKGKPVLLVYFAPDCGHCQTFMKALFQKMASLRKAEIVLITYKPLKDLKQFVADYGVGRHPNVTAGTEGSSFFIRYHYNVINLPFTVLFNSRGELAHMYRKEPSLTDLQARLKALP